MSREITHTDEWALAVVCKERTWIGDNLVVTSMQDGVYTIGRDQRKYKLYNIICIYFIFILKLFITLCKKTMQFYP